MEAATDEPAGAGVLEKDVEAITGPLNPRHEKRGDGAIQLARHSWIETDADDPPNAVPSTPVAVGSGPLPPAHGGAGSLPHHHRFS